MRAMALHLLSSRAEPLAGSQELVPWSQRWIPGWEKCLWSCQMFLAAFAELLLGWGRSLLPLSRAFLSLQQGFSEFPHIECFRGTGGEALPNSAIFSPVLYHQLVV